MPNEERAGRVSERAEPGDTGFETVEAYDVDDGVVLYDAEEPLAWLRTDSPVRPADRA